MKRLQIYYPEDLLNDLKIYAKNQGIPLAEAIRTASRQFAQKPLIRKTIRELKKRKRASFKNPFLALAGLLKNGPKTVSTTIDDIYND